jgi:Protein of unknown function (DUF2971)
MTDTAPDIYPPTLVHYTSLEGFRGILESSSIWATSIHHLNDSSEYRYTLDLLANHVFPKTPGTPEYDFAAQCRDHIGGPTAVTVYIAAFSKHKDQLSQWRAYGGGYGIALEFNSATLAMGAIAQGYRLEACVYERATQIDTLKRIFDNAFNTTSPNLKAFGTQFLKVAPTFKAQSFSEEAEWRLISLMPASGQLRFRTGKSMLVPYRSITLAQGPSSPIETVKIGPTPHADSAGIAVALMLAEHQLSSKTIWLSDIPYRSW